MVANTGVFISYRREQGFAWARLAWEDLTDHGFDAFLDLEDLRDAGHFDERIYIQIAARPYFIPVLTPGTLERCSDPDDWLRREIDYAVSTDRALVPLLVGGFDFAEADEYLPPTAARQLRNSNGVILIPDYFREAMHRLRVERLKPIDLPVEALSLADREFASEANRRASDAAGRSDGHHADDEQTALAPEPSDSAMPAERLDAGDRGGDRSRGTSVRTRVAIAIGVGALLVLGGVLGGVAFLGDGNEETAVPLAPAVAAGTVTSVRPETSTATALSTTTISTTTISRTTSQLITLGARVLADRGVAARYDARYRMLSEAGGHTFGMTDDGALVAATDGEPWRSQPAVDGSELITGGSYWRLQREANLVLYRENGEALWSNGVYDLTLGDGDSVELWIRDDEGVGVLEIVVNDEIWWQCRADDCPVTAAG